MTGKHAHITENLTQIRAGMAAACAAAGRPAGSVRLLAISKTFDATAIRAAARAGQRAFGENYLNEALAKMDALTDLDLEWHFTGPIQSNKTAEIAARFDWVHGVDRAKIARRLSDQRPDGLPPLMVCVQVNISGESSKSGAAPSEVSALCHAIAALPRLKLRGLMAIPAPIDAREDPREPFRRLRTLFEQLNTEGLALDALSAGMSDDYAEAIAEGATIVRIGTGVFGERA